MVDRSYRSERGGLDDLRHLLPGGAGRMKQGITALYEWADQLLAKEEIVQQLTPIQLYIVKDMQERRIVWGTVKQRGFMEKLAVLHLGEILE